MRAWLTKWRPNPWLLRRLLMLLALVVVGTGAFCWGRWQSADARSPRNLTDSMDLNATPTADNGEYQRRVVGYIYNNVPITREELGEYLIARMGADRLEAMINRKIVEVEYGRLKFAPVTDAEVEARFRSDLYSFGTPITEKEFVNSILRRFGKSLFEWKEDVIRPKLMMEKIVRPTVERSLTDNDYREGFEARFGPKVECRMIVFDKSDTKIQQSWAKARQSREAFLEEARKQFIPNIASVEGKVPPIHKHFGDTQLEDAAFRLKEGEISGLVQLKEGTMVLLLCEKRLPADTSTTFEKERFKIAKEMLEMRVAQKIPEVFAEMRKQANVIQHLKPGQTSTISTPVTAQAYETGVEAPVMTPSPTPQPVTPKELPAAPQAHADPKTVIQVSMPRTAPTAQGEKTPASGTTGATGVMPANLLSTPQLVDQKK